VQFKIVLGVVEGAHITIKQVNLLVDSEVVTCYLPVCVS